ncbi:MAG TPA: hypothetical protein VGP07_10515 [Polyangia bacterium]
MVLFLGACNGSTPTPVPGSGGAGGPGTGGASTGGKSGGGGVSPTGGASGAAGMIGTGGTVPVATGGANGSGGAGGSGSGSGTGGAGQTGGASGGAGSGGTGGGSGGHVGSGGVGTGGNGSGGGATGGAGGTAAGGSAVGSGGAAAATIADLGGAFCAAARNCCAKSTYPTTLDDCETKFQSRLFGLANVGKGLETIDDTALAACVAGYKQSATTCAFNPLAIACQGVFRGTKAEGAACGVGGTPFTGGVSECKVTGTATECVWTGDANVSTTMGVCHTPPHGQAGDPCASTCASNDDCVFDLLTSPGYPTGVCFEADGLYCKSSVTPSVCVAIVAAGGSCADDSSSCPSSGYCDSSGAMPRCKTAGTLGQDCSSSGFECGSSLECGIDGKCDDLGLAYDSTCGGNPPFPL